MADRHVHFLLIGGGLAAGNAALWLRKSGAEESILLVGREPDLPYDRPPCSKEYLQGKQERPETLFRSHEWYEEQRIEALTRTSVMKLDLDSRTASLSTKETVSFEKALIATGANVRRLNVPGAELDGIHYLRTLGNADTIRQDAAGKRVVLVGGSYIGCEVAASLTELGCTCEIVMMESVPLSRHFGETAGRYFQGVLEEHGITVHGGHELDHFEGADGRVGRVATKGGLSLECDVAIVGAGAMPDVMLARSAGLTLGEGGGVLADRFLESSAPGVFVAGDVAEWESVVHGGRHIRVEHWDVAFQQGKTAALNMLGRQVPHDVVPYFFSDLADWTSLEYVGPALKWDQEVLRGSLDDGEFSIWYLQDGRLRATLSVGRSEDLVEARRLISAGGALAGGGADALADLSVDLAAL
jgi:3-phenylpropionate/trans-cinnamate dioxygenase ferredoxin reductase component